MSASNTTSKVKEIETTIKMMVKSEFGANIDDVPWMLVDGLGDQPGLYMNFATMKPRPKLYWSQFFTKKNNAAPTGPIVFVDATVPDRGGTLWRGVLYHEYGHAAMDLLSKNSEPAAYTVELLALEKYLETHSDLADKFRTFVLARREARQYTGFLPSYEDRAKKAYEKLAGKPL